MMMMKKNMFPKINHSRFKNIYLDFQPVKNTYLEVISYQVFIIGISFHKYQQHNTLYLIIGWESFHVLKDLTGYIKEVDCPRKKSPIYLIILYLQRVYLH